MLRIFSFDCKMWVAVNVTAKTEAEARTKLRSLDAIPIEFVDEEQAISITEGSLDENEAENCELIEGD